MKELTLRKDRVLEAASACSEWRRFLEILCPEFFEEEKPKLQKGTWYYHKDVGCEYLVCSDGQGSAFGFFNDNWNTSLLFGNHRINKGARPATPEEIEKALIAEAEKRGFKEGVKINQDQMGDVNQGIVTLLNREEGWVYLASGDRLRFGGDTIYVRGKWAEILPSKKKMTLKEVEKELGYEIEITDA